MKKMFHFLVLLAPVFALNQVMSNDDAEGPKVHLEVLDPAFSDRWGDTIDVRKLADGFQWSEGPLWDGPRNKLWFTDVPQSKLYSWSEAKGLVVEADPSGVPVGADGFRESGLNGLILEEGGSLLVANHGARSVQRLHPETGKRETLASEFLGRRLNSPNDLIPATDGSIFFTDPPYGLEGGDKSPIKEQPFNGVYQRMPDGELRPVDVTLTRPNGIALSPDEKWLYVAISDAKSPIIMRYERKPDGRYNSGKVWFDTMKWHKAGEPGMPDGMVVAPTGEVFATGPGGVYVISPDGKLLARVKLDRSAANCTLGEDGRTLFITNADQVLRVRFTGATE